MLSEKARFKHPLKVSARPNQGQRRIYGIEHNGSTLHMRPDQRFVLRLYENPSGSHRWRMDTTTGLKVLDSWYVPTSIDRPLAGGMHMWSILVQGMGEHRLDAKLHGLQGLSFGSELRLHLKIVAD